MSGDIEYCFQILQENMTIANSTFYVYIFIIYVNRLFSVHVLYLRVQNRTSSNTRVKCLSIIQNIYMMLHVT